MSSKLALLTIHFPRLRILWCSSCAETADIFDELKANCEQPDAQTAMSIKTDLIAQDEDLKYNPVVKDILLKIPGVNSKNVNALMGKVATLYDLFQMSEDEINAIIENSKNAKAIYEFVNKTIKFEGADANNEFGFEDVDDFYVPRGEEKSTGAAATASAATTSTGASKDLLKVNRNPGGRYKRAKK